MLYEDILNAPHVLIAGTTGSGKSTLMNGIIRELITNDQYMILLDPKKVELSIYADTEKCMAYFDDKDAIIDCLSYMSDFIDGRYDTMKSKHIRMTDEEHIYIVIDELADLMIYSRKKEVQTLLQRILQIGRAAGIHVIAATQSPSRKVIPAELVLNFTDRVALRCLSAIESRQIINKSGAETLPEYGHAIYMNGKGYREIEVPFVSTEEAEQIALAYTVREVKEEPLTVSPIVPITALFAVSLGLIFISPLFGFVGMGLIIAVSVKYRDTPLY